MESDDFGSLNVTLDMLAALDPIITAVTSYRDRLVEEGFTASTAERMAEEFHRLMLTKAAG